MALFDKMNVVGFVGVTNENTQLIKTQGCGVKNKTGEHLHLFINLFDKVLDFDINIMISI